MTILATPYARPATLEAALDLLAQPGPPWLVVAGGTDVYPAHATVPIERPVLDVSRVAGLRGISREADGGWRIGALSTWTDIAETAVLPSAFDGLRAAARQVGGRQIQNVGTVAGNVVNASPASDGVPNLLALDAVVECVSGVRGVRRVPLAAFLAGPGSTILAPDELVTGMLIPDLAGDVRSAFHKLGGRAYLVISIVSVATVLVLDADRVVRSARVCVGACSPVPVRLAVLEASLVGRVAAPDLGALAMPEHLAGLSPIDDVRAPAEYRLDAALTLVRRALAAGAQ